MTTETSWMSPPQAFGPYSGKPGISTPTAPNWYTSGLWMPPSMSQPQIAMPPQLIAMRMGAGGYSPQAIQQALYPQQQAPIPTPFEDELQRIRQQSVSAYRESRPKSVLETLSAPFSYLYEHVDVPFASTVKYLWEEMYPGESEFERTYDRLRASGESYWSAAAGAYHDWDSPWGLKGFMEMANPIYWIPGAQLAKPVLAIGRTVGGVARLGAVGRGIEKLAWAGTRAGLGLERATAYPMLKPLEMLSGGRLKMIPPVSQQMAALREASETGFFKFGREKVTSAQVLGDITREGDLSLHYSNEIPSFEAMILEELHPKGAKAALQEAGENWRGVEHVLRILGGDATAASHDDLVRMAMLGRERRLVRLNMVTELDVMHYEVLHGAAKGPQQLFDIESRGICYALRPETGGAIPFWPNVFENPGAWKGVTPEMELSARAYNIINKKLDDMLEEAGLKVGYYEPGGEGFHRISNIPEIEDILKDWTTPVGLINELEAGARLAHDPMKALRARIQIVNELVVNRETRNFLAPLAKEAGEMLEHFYPNLQLEYQITKHQIHMLKKKLGILKAIAGREPINHNAARPIVQEFPETAEVIDKAAARTEWDYRRYSEEHKRVELNDARSLDEAAERQATEPPPHMSEKGKERWRLRQKQYGFTPTTVEGLPDRIYRYRGKRGVWIWDPEARKFYRRGYEPPELKAKVDRLESEGRLPTETQRADRHYPPEDRDVYKPPPDMEPPVYEQLARINPTDSPNLQTWKQRVREAMGIDRAQFNVKKAEEEIWIATQRSRDPNYKYRLTPDELQDLDKYIADLKQDMVNMRRGAVHEPSVLGPEDLVYDRRKGTWVKKSETGVSEHVPGQEELATIKSRARQLVIDHMAERYARWRNPDAGGAPLRYKDLSAEQKIVVDDVVDVMGVEFREYGRDIAFLSSRGSEATDYWIKYIETREQKARILGRQIPKKKLKAGEYAGPERGEGTSYHSLDPRDKALVDADPDVMMALDNAREASLRSPADYGKRKVKPGKGPITVRNIKDKDLHVDPKHLGRHEVYIGRKFGDWPESIYGNPFYKTHPSVAKRAAAEKISLNQAAVNMYEEWLRHGDHMGVTKLATPQARENILRSLRRGDLEGKTLLCFCKPDPCHGDILKQMSSELFRTARAEYGGPVKIISGGQTGVDQAGLLAAKKLGIETGGTAPKGYLTEKGPDLRLKTEFGLEESTSEMYAVRTRLNVEHSDGTVLFGDVTSRGTAMTIEYCKQAKKPYITNPEYWELERWLLENNIEILNVAGNRLRKAPEASARAHETLNKAITNLREGKPKGAGGGTPVETFPVEQNMEGWARRAPENIQYEVSTKGDKRFSALNARLRPTKEFPRGRTIEEAYQLDVKGYRSDGLTWREAKNKPPKSGVSESELYEQYKSLWKQWADENPGLIRELRAIAGDKATGYKKVLTDMFANTDVTQARALREILDETAQAAGATGATGARTYKGMITDLTPNQVFVFGSNTDGFHGAGSAGYATFGDFKTSWRDTNYAAQPSGTKGKWNQKGVGEGLQQGTEGRSYAIPTVDAAALKAGAGKRSRTPEQITESIRKFYAQAAGDPQTEYLVAMKTELGMSGYTGDEMARMFADAGTPPPNVVFDRDFRQLVDADLGPAARQPEQMEPEAPRETPPITDAEIKSFAKEAFEEEVYEMEPPSWRTLLKKRPSGPDEIELADLIKATENELARKRALVKEVGAKLEEAKKVTRRSGQRIPITQKMKELGRLKGEVGRATEMVYIEKPGFEYHLFPREVAERVNQALEVEAASWLKAINNLSAASRTLTAAMDFSAGFIHGLPLLGLNPGIWAKAMYRHFEVFFRHEGYLKELLSVPWRAKAVREMIAHGSEIATSEYVEILEKLAGLSLKGGKAKGAASGLLRVAENIGGRFERSFSSFSILGRVELWESMKVAYPRKEWNELAKGIDRMFGTVSYAHLGIGKVQRTFEGAFVFFAPRYTRAGFAFLSNLFKTNVQGTIARQAMARLATSGVIFYLGFCKMTGQEADLNPASPGFMTLNIAGHNMGIGSFVTSVIRLIGNVTADVIETADGDKPISALFTPNLDNSFIRFMRAKSAPFTGSVLEAITGENYIGEPFESTSDWLGFLGSKITPIWAQETFGIGTQHGFSPGAFPGEIMGFRTFPVSEWEHINQMRDNYAMAMYGKEYRDLNELQQEHIDTENTAISERIEAMNQEKLKRGDVEATFWDKWDSIQETYYDTIWQAQKGVEAGMMSLTQFRDVVENAGFTKRGQEDLLKSMGEYASVVDAWLKPGKQPTFIEDIAYDDYISMMYGTSITDQYGIYSFEEKQRRETEFREKWGDAIYGYVQERLRYGKDEPPLLREYRRVQEITQSYWDIHRILINTSSNEDLKQLDAYATQIGNTNPEYEDYLRSTHPLLRWIKQMEDLLKQYRRTNNPELDQILSLWYAR